LESQPRPSLTLVKCPRLDQQPMLLPDFQLE